MDLTQAMSSIDDMDPIQVLLRLCQMSTAEECLDLLHNSKASYINPLANKLRQWLYSDLIESPTIDVTLDLTLDFNQSTEDASSLIAEINRFMIRATQMLKWKVLRLYVVNRSQAVAVPATTQHNANGNHQPDVVSQSPELPSNDPSPIVSPLVGSPSRDISSDELHSTGKSSLNTTPNSQLQSWPSAKVEDPTQIVAGANAVESAVDCPEDDVLIASDESLAQTQSAMKYNPAMDFAPSEAVQQDIRAQKEAEPCRKGKERALFTENDEDRFLETRHCRFHDDVETEEAFRSSMEDAMRASLQLQVRMGNGASGSSHHDFSSEATAGPSLKDKEGRVGLDDNRDKFSNTYQDKDDTNPYMQEALRASMMYNPNEEITPSAQPQCDFPAQAPVGSTRKGKERQVVIEDRKHNFLCNKHGEVDNEQFMTYSYNLAWAQHHKNIQEGYLEASHDPYELGHASGLCPPHYMCNLTICPMSSCHTFNIEWAQIPSTDDNNTEFVLALRDNMENDSLLHEIKFSTLRKQVFEMCDPSNDARVRPTQAVLQHEIIAADGKKYIMLIDLNYRVWRGLMSEHMPDEIRRWARRVFPWDYSVKNPLESITTGTTGLNGMQIPTGPRKGRLVLINPGTRAPVSRHRGLDCSCRGGGVARLPH